MSRPPPGGYAVKRVPNALDPLPSHYGRVQRQTTDAEHHYVDADVNGSESSYRSFLRSSSTNVTVMADASTVNSTANTITATNVSSFSDWSASEVLVPSAAAVSIGGRVSTHIGGGLPNTVLTLTTTDGSTQTARTNSFGYYRFDGIEVGQTITVSVRSKQYQFATQVVQIFDELSELNFVPEKSVY